MSRSCISRTTALKSSAHLQEPRDMVTDAFHKHTDSRFQRRRSRQKSVDVMAIQQLCQDMGTKVSMVELFLVLKDYKHPQGMFGQIKYDEFLVVLRNARSEHQNNPMLKAAFKSLGGSISDNGETTAIPMSNVTKSLSKLKEFGIDVCKLEAATSSKEDTDTMDFNEFAACLC